MSLFETAATEFQRRHIGPDEQETSQMLKSIGVSSLTELMDRTVPEAIRMQQTLQLPGPMSEAAYLQHIKEVSLKNKIAKNYIGQGYYDTYTPSVILRNVFENPGWYTQYTPYQAEIAQGHGRYGLKSLQAIIKLRNWTKRFLAPWYNIPTTKARWKITGSLYSRYMLLADM